MADMSFRTHTPPVWHGDGIGNHNGTNVANTKNLQGGFNRRDRDDPISGVCQHSVPDWSQNPFCRDGKDCWAHIFVPSIAAGFQL